MGKRFHTLPSHPHWGFTWGTETNNSMCIFSMIRHTAIKTTDVNWMIVCVSGVALFSNRPVIDCVFGAAKWLTVCIVLPCSGTGPRLTVSGVALFRYRPMIDCVWCCLYSGSTPWLTVCMVLPCSGTGPWLCLVLLCSGTGPWLTVSGVAFIHVQSHDWLCLVLPCSGTGPWLCVWCCHVQEQAHDCVSGVALFRNTHPTECVWCCLFQKQAHNCVSGVAFSRNRPITVCVVLAWSETTQRLTVCLMLPC